MEIKGINKISQNMNHSLCISQVWTSQLKRAVGTAKYIRNILVEQWKALDEMDFVSTT